MNIESTNVNRVNDKQNQSKNSAAQQQTKVSFANELEEVKKDSSAEKSNETEVSDVNKQKDVEKEKSDKQVDKANVDSANKLENSDKESLEEQNSNDDAAFEEKLKDFGTKNYTNLTDKHPQESTNAFNKNGANIPNLHKYIEQDNSAEKSDNIEFFEESALSEHAGNKGILNNKKHIGTAIDNLTSVVSELNQSEEKQNHLIKKNKDLVDNNNMINNDYNISENKDNLPLMNLNMNFSGDGQPFSSFMNNSQEQKPQQKLASLAKDLEEEAAILSSMTENIAIANKNQVLNDTKTIMNEEGIKKVDAKSGIKIETVVSYDTILMNEADVEVFTELVENGQVNVNKLAPQAAERSINVSKTLADMLAKSMENNQPVRINFDNNISVIIRISRDGKITADFLPSSQVAEAYLKENLPLLRQRFDDNNIEYDSLNQRERRNSDKENNRKKDRNNE